MQCESLKVLKLKDVNLSTKLVARQIGFRYEKKQADGHPFMKFD